MGRLTFSNTGKTDLTDIAEGLYISRGQSEVSHESFPDNWQYFGPYEESHKPAQYHSHWGDDNTTEYENGKVIEFVVAPTFDKEFNVTVRGQLVKTWEDFEEEDDNVHHFYFEEYKILEVIERNLNETYMNLHSVIKEAIDVDDAEFTAKLFGTLENLCEQNGFKVVNNMTQVLNGEIMAITYQKNSPNNTYTQQITYRTDSTDRNFDYKAFVNVPKITLENGVSWSWIVEPADIERCFDDLKGYIERYSVEPIKEDVEEADSIPVISDALDKMGFTEYNDRFMREGNYKHFINIDLDEEIITYAVYKEDTLKTEKTFEITDDQSVISILKEINAMVEGME